MLALEAREGGHQLLILYEGGGFDPETFTLLKDAWNHEHCKHCVSRIDALELCWVSTGQHYTILCEACHALVVGTQDVR